MNLRVRWGNGRFAAAALVTGASVAFVAAQACEQPTQITLVVETDIPCPELKGVTITVGQLGDIDARPPAVSTTRCGAGGYVGSLVVVPSGGRQDNVAIRVVGGLTT